MVTPLTTLPIEQSWVAITSTRNKAAVKQLKHTETMRAPLLPPPRSFVPGAAQRV